ncbi:MAG: lycopene cyclase domain-containing protein [Ktedonobacterales bacterium]
MSHWPYLPFLVLWALPVLAVQWIFGGRYLWRERRIWPWVALGLCVWFTLADAIAINAGIWSFDRAALVGLYLGPVPLEEVLFYLLTALMVTQGFVTLWFGYQDRVAYRRRFAARLSRLRTWRPGRAPDVADPAHTMKNPG